MMNDVEYTFESNLDAVLDGLAKAKEEKLLAVGEHARAKIVEKLSGSRSGRTYTVPGTSTQYTASAPGEPPALASNYLRENIDYQKDGDDVIVGTPAVYGPRLEFGFSGQDALGRFYNQAARPWLKPTLEEEMRAMKAILGEDWLDE